MTTRTSAALVWPIVLAGCGGTLDSYAEDATTELAVDAIPEPVSEPPFDAGPELFMDFIPDPSPDPGTDPGTDPGIAGTLGSSCSLDVDCDGMPGPDVLCMDTIGGYFSFPGGYCTAYCTDDSPCGIAGSCIVMYSYGLCMKPCTSPADCRIAEGYTCAEIPYITSDTYCVPAI